jgi:hypothetical protein
MRQLYILVDRIGVMPPAPEPVELYKDLPLPAAIW